MWPVHLCHDWSMGSIPLVTSLADARNVATLALLLSLAGVATATAKWYSQALLADAGAVGGSHGGQPSKVAVVGVAHAAVVGVVVAALAFLPASNALFYVGFVAAERVMYLPAIGAALVLAAGMATVLKRGAAKPGGVGAGVIVAVVLLLACGWRSHVRCHDWFDHATLTAADVATNPRNAKLWYDRGVVLAGSGQTEEADAAMRRAAELVEDDSNPHVLFAIGNKAFLDGNVRGCVCRCTPSDVS